MQRILVLGCSGSGKSTLARELGPRLGLPIIHLDQVHWQPGWVESDRQDFLQSLAPKIAAGRWIVDGNYTSTLATRLPRADTILFLDYPRWISVLRVLKRIVTSYGKVRPDMAPGCPEQIDFEFLHYVWNFKHRHGKDIRAMLAATREDQTLLVFKRPSELTKWMADLALKENRVNAETI